MSVNEITTADRKITVEYLAFLRIKSLNIAKRHRDFTKRMHLLALGNCMKISKNYGLV